MSRTSTFFLVSCPKGQVEKYVNVEAMLYSNGESWKTARKAINIPLYRAQWLLSEERQKQQHQSLHIGASCLETDSAKIPKINRNMYFVLSIFLSIQKDLSPRTSVIEWNPWCLQRRQQCHTIIKTSKFLWSYQKIWM